MNLVRGGTGSTRVRFISKPTAFLAAVGVAIVVAMSWSSQAFASPGDLDPDFGTGGLVTTNLGDSEATDIAEQTDHKLVTVGRADGDWAITRYLESGSLDPSFSGDGSVITDLGGDSDSASAVALQPDGKIVVGGTMQDFSGIEASTKFALARYNTDGSLDQTFGGDGTAEAVMGDGSSVAYEIAIQPDGSIAIAGRASVLVDVGDFSMWVNHVAVARFESDGDLDPTFGGGDGVEVTGFAGTAFALELASDGKLLVGGRVNSDFAVASLNVNGSPDSSFGGGDGLTTVDISETGSQANSIAVRANGSFVAGGWGNGLELVQFTSNGELDPSFGGGDGRVTTFVGMYELEAILSLDIQSDGRIVAGGEVGQQFPSFTDFALVRYNPKGSLDTSFGGGDGKVVTDVGGGTSQNWANATLVDFQGNIVLAGGSGNSSYDFALARFLGGGPTPPDEHDLTISKFGTGSGAVDANPGMYCQGTCGESYIAGTEVVITAYPDEGTTFAGWGGDCSGTGDCQITMGANKSVTANFTLGPPAQHTLTAAKSGTGQGTIASTPSGINCGSDCSQAFDEGTQVTLNANATAGSTFTGWSGAGCSGTGTCQVNLDSNKTATANFTLNPPVERTLTAAKTGTGQGTITSTPSGIDCGADCSGAYNDGTVVTLTATPQAGSTFTGWSGAGCSGTGTCQVNLDSNKTATASFTVDTVIPPTPEATISKVSVSGPSKLKKGKAKTYKVKVTNSGDATATGVKLSVSGKGIKSSAKVGSVAAGKTVTVKVKIKAKKPGRIKAKFKVTSTNGGSKTATKKITVKK